MSNTSNIPASASSDASPMMQRYAEARLPTTHGDFRVLVYRSLSLSVSVNSSNSNREAIALISPDLEFSGDKPVLARVHSECMTGEVFGSTRCDCKAQLELAMTRIGREGGVIVYLRQEGRGIGLADKIRAYELQDRGADTVDANLALGFAADERNYSSALAIFADLKIGAVRLMTNNPRKIEALRKVGIKVTREPHWTEPVAQAAHYLETKRARLGHLFNDTLNSEPEPTPSS